MGAALHAAVEQDVDLVADGVDDFRELIEGAARTVQLPPAVIGNDDARATDIDGFAGIVGAHHAFEAELSRPTP